MFTIFNRSNLLRAAVVAVGSALAIPALAQTDMIPLDAGRVGSAYAEFAGRTVDVAPARDPSWNIANEPGFVPDARGAYGAYATRTPLASVSPYRGATDAYGAALNQSAN